MKAAIVTDQGVRIADVPQPQPKPNEVLVRVRAAGLNRADLGVASGRAHGRIGGAGSAGRSAVTFGLAGFALPALSQSAHRRGLNPASSFGLSAEARAYCRAASSSQSTAARRPMPGGAWPFTRSSRSARFRWSNEKPPRSHPIANPPCRGLHRTPPG